MAILKVLTDFGLGYKKILDSKKVIGSIKVISSTKVIGSIKVLSSLEVYLLATGTRLQNTATYKVGDFQSG